MHCTYYSKGTCDNDLSACTRCKPVTTYDEEKVAFDDENNVSNYSTMAPLMKKIPEAPLPGLHILTFE